jgi:hypothetical protein
MNVNDLVALADLSGVMRSNGIRRACFATDGSVSECELDPKYEPPPEPERALTPEEQAVAKVERMKAAERQKRIDDALMFAAAEGFPRELIES